MFEKAVNVLLIILVAAFLLIGGCSEKGGGTRYANLPPDTFISFGPREESFTYYKVQAYWYGADEDGDIDHYEVTTVKNLTDSTLALLDFDALDWGVTFSGESTFIMLADSCCLDSTDKPSPGAEYAGSPWGILVRSVDREGAVDPTPAALFFIATNVIPKGKIEIPRKPIGYVPLVPPHPYIEWSGKDPDGEARELMYKYIVIPSDSLKAKYPRLPPLDYEGPGPDSLKHDAPPIGRWSEWVPSDCTYVKDLNLSRFIESRDTIHVYVTVKDEGGAYLPEKLFGAYNNWANWTVFGITRLGGGVTIVVDAGGLGRRKSNNVSEYKNNVAAVFKGAEVSFRFWGLEDRVRGKLASAYRYYYDNPDAPGSAWNYWTGITDKDRQRGSVPEWLVRYPPDGSKLIPDFGPHAFVVELVDVNQETTHCEFNFEILRGPDPYGEHKILLVDDTWAEEWPEPRPPAYEDSSDNFWLDVLNGYNIEVFDTRRGQAYTKKVPVRMVGLATTVIWVVDEDLDQPDTQLLQACWDYGNYLYSYIKVGGNLIIVGKSPVRDCAYWPDKQRLDPQVRSRMTSYDFRPQVSGGDTVYNFMWDVFGIKRMRQSSERKINALISCGICNPEWADTIFSRPYHEGGYEGEIGGAFYITDLRSPDDEDYPLYVEPMFATGYYNSAQGEWEDVSDDEVIAVYVPAHDGYGHAAYIGLPAYYFNHDDMKRVIRKLLTRFGESPIGQQDEEHR